MRVVSSAHSFGRGSPQSMPKPSTATSEAAHRDGVAHRSAGDGFDRRQGVLDPARRAAPSSPPRPVRARPHRGNADRVVEQLQAARAPPVARGVREAPRRATSGSCRARRVSRCHGCRHRRVVRGHPQGREHPDVGDHRVGPIRSTARRRCPSPPLGRDFLATALEGAPNKIGTLFASWSNVRRDLAAAATKAGVPYYSPKDLRRACASWLVQKGVHLFAVSKVLRRGSTGMVEQVYGHHAKGTLRTVIEQQLATAARPLCPGCLTGGFECDPSDVCDSGNSEDRADMLCPGTESNCRHADFQAPSQGARDHGFRRLAAPPQGADWISAGTSRSATPSGRRRCHRG